MSNARSNTNAASASAAATKTAVDYGAGAAISTAVDIDTDDIASIRTDEPVQIISPPADWCSTDFDTSAREVATKSNGLVLLRTWVDYMVNYTVSPGTDIAEFSTARLPDAKTLCENLTKTAIESVMVRVAGAIGPEASSGLIGTAIDESPIRTYAKSITPTEIVCRVRVRVLCTRTARDKELRGQSLTALQWPIEERLREEIDALNIENVTPMVASMEPVLGYKSMLDAGGAGHNGAKAGGRTLFNGIVSMIFGDLFKPLSRKQQVAVSATQEPGQRVQAEYKAVRREYDEEWLCGLFLIPDEEDEGSAIST